jgi:YegS/Rv2252/BmrU family lipid kinase
MEAIEQRRHRWNHFEVAMTRGSGHARELAQEAAERGDPMILAIGGDGTVNEVAWGVLGSNTVLGLVPTGSGNGLARTLGLSRNPLRALSQLETGVRKRMDVGLVNGRPFLNVAGAGFDAVVAETFQQWGVNGGRRGILPYVVFCLQHAFKYGERNRRLEVAGETIEGPTFIVAFANGRQYGGGAIIAPRAYLDDGEIEAVHIARVTHAQALANVHRLFLGTIEGFGNYRSWSGSSAVLESSEPVPHHRDGEPEAADSHLEISVAPRALEIVVPRRTVEGPHNPFLPSANS